MKLEFRIDFGYQYLYSRKHYHPEFVWDGTLEVDNGRIDEVYRLEYPYSWYGPAMSAKRTRLNSPSWQIKTKRNLTGLWFSAEVEEDSIFTFDTKSAKISFSANDIKTKGRLEFLVGPKYLGCYVTVTLDGYLWYRPKLKEGQRAYEYDAFNSEITDYARLKHTVIKAGEGVEWEDTVSDTGKDCQETLLHFIFGATQSLDDTQQIHNCDIPMQLVIDGDIVCEFERFFREHDHLAIIEDDWKRVAIKPGKHRFMLRNVDKNGNILLLNRIVMQECGYNHAEISVPDWALVGEKVIGKIFSTKVGNTQIKIGEDKCFIHTHIGWNEFDFTPQKGGILRLSTDTDSKDIEVYNVEKEKHPVKVGYDLTTVPHDENGYMDWLLDYTYRTRLGNYIVFRNFRSHQPDELYRKWGKFLRKRKIYISDCREFHSGALVEAAGEYMNDCGTHEGSTFMLYAFDPHGTPEVPGRIIDANVEKFKATLHKYKSNDMKEATEGVINYIKNHVDKVHQVFDTAGFGDASGAIRHSYLAGTGFIRAETMVGHTQPILAKTRASSEALSDGRWGVHIAIQHHYQPYRESHLGQYFLALMQPWAMGAEAIYEEDSLFNLWKEERQTFDDYLTKGKRDMTRAFYKFAKTHPRMGKCVRNIAFIEGRYAAPFNGFICDSEQDPHYAVFGAFGNPDKSWGHGQPEKCRAVLDCLMPGANTHPLRQKFDKRRFFFSGTPYGDFDEVPIEAKSEYMSQYSLMLNLGWNTMIDEDYEKLLNYVKGGGVLLTGIPQFSKNIKREFLNDLNELNLYRDGDLTEMCGIRVLSKGKTYCGEYITDDNLVMEKADLSSLPSDGPEEDGEAILANIILDGAEVVCRDKANGEAVLVRHKVGKGYVYTFTLWGYPGHEKFQNTAAEWVMHLAKETLTDSYVIDPSKEVFYSRWEDESEKRLILLNTDWTVRGNVKKVDAIIGDHRITLEVKEREMTVVSLKNDNISVQKYTL